MKRRSRCEWMPMLPWPIWPLAGHARLGQNVVVGSMTILLSWLCWGASQEEVCLDPCFLCNLTPPRCSVELPRAVVGLLAGPGVVWQLDFGDFVMLQPERINAYAAAVIRSA